MISDLVKRMLSESPDRVSFKNGVLEHDDSDAYPFALHDGEFYFGGQGRAHYQMVYHMDELTDKWMKANKEQGKKLKMDHDFEIEPRDFLDYPGRAWAKRKIISFWKYPERSDFLKVIKGLNSSLPRRGYAAVDSSWFVEVYPDKTVKHWDSPGVLVPIDEYKSDGLKKVLDDINQMHVMSPEKKKKELEKKGVTPKALNFKLPKDMTMAQYKSLIRQESYGYLPKFKDYYFDE